MRMIEKIYPKPRAGKGSRSQKLRVEIFCSAQYLQTDVYFGFHIKQMENHLSKHGRS